MGPNPKNFEGKIGPVDGAFRGRFLDFSKATLHYPSDTPDRGFLASRMAVSPVTFTFFS
jgi:hypothetical protein